jgi:DNA-binding winged helix-turn-helix (wHTH) protein/tetratricopeptide (TPR) repeat protein
MASPLRTPIRYYFGLFELDPVEGKLSLNGTRVKLQDLPFRLLVLLVEKPGEIVTREEVRRRLWPQDTFVEFDNSLGVAVRKLREALRDDAEAPRFVETVPRRGYRFVAPVTAKDSGSPAIDEIPDPALQPKGATNLPAPVKEISRTAASASSWRGRYSIIASLVLLMVGITVYEFQSNPRHSAAKVENGVPLPRVHPRRAVAVLGFRNLAGNPADDWLSTAFTEMLSTELAAGGGLRLVPGEDVARAKRELPLADEDTLARATLDRLRTNPGADVVVLGAYTLLQGKTGNRIRLDVRVQDTAAGETITEEALTGTEDKLFELAAHAGVDLRQSLGVGAISAEAANAMRASLPANERAVRLYAEGRAKLWGFDIQGARDLLIKAVAADPGYPLAHSALSEAWWHQGYVRKAREEAQQALDLSQHLPREEQLLVEGQYRRAIADWPKAVQAYQSLFSLFPDRLDYGLLLASAQMNLKPADSITTLEALRHLPPPAGDDARIDMMEASAWIDTDFTKARAAAQRAIDKASAQGSHVLVARTYGILCQQGPSIEVSADAIRECQIALQSSIAAGDINGEAMMLTDLADLYYQQGDLTRAEKMWREAIRQFRQIGNPDGVSTALSNIGGTLLTRGDLVKAKNLLQESIPGYQAVEDKSGVALALNNLGDLSRQQGNLQAAETTYQQAKATAQEIDDKNAIAYVLTGLGDVFTDRGDLTAARRSYEEALAMRNQAGEKQAAAETQVALAHLDIEEGHAADAEAALHKYKEQFHQAQETDDELAASAALIQALLAEGNEGDAKKEMEGARALASHSQNRLARFEFDLALARVLSASDQATLSRAQLENTLREAHRLGFAGVEFEARLELAELEKKSGHAAAARTQLAALETSARDKGFDLVARKAATAR